MSARYSQRNSRLLVAIVCVAGALALLASTAEAEVIQAKTARLGWLDKINARVGEIKVPVGQTVDLGSLKVSVDSCTRRVPPDDPESASFIKITEQVEGQAIQNIFEGWMFASSPALSAMDHGVYDVWVLECEIPTSQEAGSVRPPPVQDDARQPPVDIDSIPLD